MTSSEDASNNDASDTPSEQTARKHLAAWDSLPEEIDAEFFGTLSIGQIRTIEREGADHLTDAQMATFNEHNAAWKAKMPKVKVGHLFPKAEMFRTVRPNTIGNLGQNRPPLLATRLSEISKLAAKQSSIAERLASSSPEVALARSSPKIPTVDTHDLAASMREANERKARREAERVHREQLMVDLLAATSESTAALAKIADAQDRRISSQSALTGLLAFAVMFDVVNGSFDDHNWMTTLLSAGAGLLAIGGATFLGERWSNRGEAEVVDEKV